MARTGEFTKIVKSATNIQENKQHYRILLDKIILISGNISGKSQLESNSGFLVFI